MWIFKVGKFEYIYICQVLSQKKKKKKKIYIYIYMWETVENICGFIYVENMIVGRMQRLY